MPTTNRTQRRLAAVRAVLIGLTVLVCTAGVATDVSARQIPPSKLVVRPSELPGFALAEHGIASTTSARRIAKEFFKDKPAEVVPDVNRLNHEGLRLGVLEWFEYARAYAESDASVYSSSRGARGELASNLRFLVSQGGRRERFTAPSVPGSIGVSFPGASGRTDDVLFTSGRCFFVVWNHFEAPVTQEESRRAPLAGASRLFKRVKGLCR
jgi:hypothetical protein